LETASGTVIRESLVLLQYFEDRFVERPVRQRDPLRRAIENMLAGMERSFVNAGYSFVLNQDPSLREKHLQRMLAEYEALDAFLSQHAPDSTFLFEDFGWAETVLTPMFMRFWFLEHYEDFALPEEPKYARVRRFRDACVAHPAAQQVTREEIVKVYYDYAQGAGNGELVAGRTRSSFELEPHWSSRPMPPRGKYGARATDRELGLL
jgi:glutathione S-transferase